jgi:hypothetical protein
VKIDDLWESLRIQDKQHNKNWGASDFRVGWGEKMGDPRDPPVMQDKELYENLFGLSAPWSFQEVDLRRRDD